MGLESHYPKMWSMDVGLWKTDPKGQQGKTEKSNFNVRFLLQSWGSWSTWWAVIAKGTKVLKAKLLSFVHRTMDWSFKIDMSLKRINTFCSLCLTCKTGVPILIYRKAFSCVFEIFRNLQNILHMDEWVNSLLKLPLQRQYLITKKKKKVTVMPL